MGWLCMGVISTSGGALIVECGFFLFGDQSARVQGRGPAESVCDDAVRAGRGRESPERPKPRHAVAEAEGDVVMAGTKRVAPPDAVSSPCADKKTASAAISRRHGVGESGYGATAGAPRRARGTSKWRAPQGPPKPGGWPPPPPRPAANASPARKPTKGPSAAGGGTGGRASVPTSRVAAAVSTSADSAQLEGGSAALREGTAAARVARAVSASDKLRRIRSARTAAQSADRREADAGGDGVRDVRGGGGGAGGGGVQVRGDVLAQWAGEALQRAVGRRTAQRGPDPPLPAVSASCTTIAGTSRFVGAAAGCGTDAVQRVTGVVRVPAGAGADVACGLVAASFLLPPSVNFVPEYPERVRLSEAALDALRAQRQPAPPASLMHGDHVRECAAGAAAAAEDAGGAGEAGEAAGGRSPAEGGPRGLSAGVGVAGAARVGGASLATLRRDEDDVVRLGTGQTPSCSPDLAVGDATHAQGGDGSRRCAEGAAEADGPPVEAGVDVAAPAAGVGNGEAAESCREGDAGGGVGSAGDAAVGGGERGGGDAARLRLGGVGDEHAASGGERVDGGEDGSGALPTAGGGGGGWSPEGAAGSVGGGAPAVDKAEGDYGCDAGMAGKRDGNAECVGGSASADTMLVVGLQGLEGRCGDEGSYRGGSGEHLRTPVSARRRWGAAAVLDGVLEHGGVPREVVQDGGMGGKNGSSVHVAAVARYDEEDSPNV